MSAEVICLSSSDEDSIASASSSRRVVAKSLNKSSATAAAHGKKAQKRHAASPTAAAAATTGSSNSSIKKLKVENIPVGHSSDVGAMPVQVADIVKKVIKPQLVVVTRIPIPPADEDVFQNFVATCRQRRNDEDAKKVLYKLEKLHSKLSTVQKEDNEFRLLINNCHNMISKGLTKDIYTPILELHTEIKRLINMKPPSPVAQKQWDPAAMADDGLQQQESGEEDEEQEEQAVTPSPAPSKGNTKKIKLLESSIEKCLKKIKMLEEKEVDFDDDVDSAYIQEDKYKKRLIQLCNALSLLNDDKVLRRQLVKKKIKRKDISGDMTSIPLVDEAILNFVNSDIQKINQFKHLESAQRCADHIKMPEYLDILKCIGKCNKESNLDLSQGKMETLAKRAFQTVGNFLKRKRVDETESYLKSLVDNDASKDPAIKDVKLNEKLRENKKMGDEKLDEIFKKYVDKQEGMCVEEDMEKQQSGSSDSEDGYSSSNSGESDPENLTTTADAAAAKSQVDNGTQTVGPIKNGTISSSSCSSDEDNEEKRANLECRAAIGGDDDDLFIIKDNSDDLSGSSTKKKDPLDIKQFNQAASSVCQTKRQAFTPTTVETAFAAQRNVSPAPSPRHKPVATAAAVDTSSKENTGEVNSCYPQDQHHHHKTPIIKVCAFAKPPPAWGSLSNPSSPEKVKKNSKPPMRQSPKLRLQAPLECIDLTREEREKQASKSERPPSTSSARSINPLANVKRTTSSSTAASGAATSQQPVKRVVIVKNVINNFNVPLSDASVAAVAPGGRNIFHSSRSTAARPVNAQNDANNRRDDVWLSKDKVIVKRPFTK